MPDYVVKQLRQLYAAQINSDGVLRVNVVPCQIQPNGAECGVFAAAFAFEWACGNLDLGCSFDVAQMRGHMVKCLELDSIQSFEKVTTKKKGRKRRDIVVCVKALAID